MTREGGAPEDGAPPGSEKDKIAALLSRIAFILCVVAAGLLALLKAL